MSQRRPPAACHQDEADSMSDEHERTGPQPGAPEAAAGHQQPDVPAPRSADLPAQQARILILEDDAWDAELADRLLTSAGLHFTAVVVDSRDSFTEQLSAFHPDLILSDFSLPGFTGADALKIAQARVPDVPVIIWAGALGDAAALDLIKQGATDYILKDRPARLASAVSRALIEAAQRARLAALEQEVGQAQRLASLGHLVAAEQAVGRTRQMLAAARRDLEAAEPPS